MTAESAAVEAKRATSTIPIVLALANDPPAGGLVESLARPGGNVTSLSLQAPEIAGKRLGLLREIFPAARRLAILTNAGYLAAGANHPMPVSPHADFADHFARPFN